MEVFTTTSPKHYPLAYITTQLVCIIDYPQAGAVSRIRRRILDRRNSRGIYWESVKPVSVGQMRVGRLQPNWNPTRIPVRTKHQFTNFLHMI